MDKLLESLKDPEICLALLGRIKAELDTPLRFMEVCGTHTVSIFRSGLRSLLPEGVTHLSGPGCPVCVTHDIEIADCIDIAGLDGVILATFGDLLRVPDDRGRTLKRAKADGARVEVVYSPFNALELAKENPGCAIVFPGIGFETTAPLVAATVQMAKSANLKNFYILSCHKLVPPVLKFLLDSSQENRADESIPKIDGFLLPGHVSTVLGLSPFHFVAKEYGVPGVVGGFEPSEILQALLVLIRMRKENSPKIINAYKIAVADEGNPKARKVMSDVFVGGTGLWRGMNLIENSALTLKDDYAKFDARRYFNIESPIKRYEELSKSGMINKKGCRCGDVLMGKISPPECMLFGKICAPQTPIGPCMVSTEGSCAAYYKYAG